MKFLFSFVKFLQFVAKKIPMRLSWNCPIMALSKAGGFAIVFINYMLGISQNSVSFVKCLEKAA
jgi:hypothetical protein